MHVFASPKSWLVLDSPFYDDFIFKGHFSVSGSLGGQKNLLVGSHESYYDIQQRLYKIILVCHQARMKSQAALVVVLFGLLTIRTTLVRAYASGAPKCSTPAPNHGTNRITSAKRKLTLSKAKFSIVKSPTNTRNLTLEVRYTSEFEGILLRPKKGYRGRFTGYNDCMLKELEGGNCVTHKDSMPKPHVMRFNFLAESNANPTSKFEVIILESYSRWITTDRFRVVSSLG